MSYTASIFDTKRKESSYQIATNSGYDDLCDWIDTLDSRVYIALSYLRNDGWIAKAFRIADELPDAVKEHPPKPSVQRTIKGLLRFIKANDQNGILVIT